MTTLNELRAEILPVYEHVKAKAKYADCSRCIGKGDISAFRHVKGGVCFKCGGSKKAPTNKAGRDASQLGALFASVRYSWKLGIKEIDTLPQTIQIREILQKYTKKAA